MILSDHDIRVELKAGNLGIKNSPDLEKNIQPASVDFHLGEHLMWYCTRENAGIDPRDMKSVKVEEKILKDGETFWLQPGEFVLGVTREWLEMPDNIVSRVEGRSSIGRLGLIVHVTAGYVDPGFHGCITLEIANVNTVPIALFKGLRLGQFAFEYLKTPADMPYNKKPDAKYFGQKGVLQSKYDKKK